MRADAGGCEEAAESAGALLAVVGAGGMGKNEKSRKINILRDLFFRNSDCPCGVQVRCGEYEIRTRDLLHAMQAL